jgi:predicted nuclease of predicted toxin-antitoxin system
MAKKHSASKTDAPPDPIFFVDRSLGGRKVVDALRAAGARVEGHADHFAKDAPDEEWLVRAGTEGWVVLTKDTLRARPIEMKVLAATGVRTIILARGHLRGEEMAAILVAHLQGMIRLCGREPGPFVARIGGTGLKLVKRSNDLLE